MTTLDEMDYLPPIFKDYLRERETETADLRRRVEALEHRAADPEREQFLPDGRPARYWDSMPEHKAAGAEEPPFYGTTEVTQGNPTYAGNPVVVGAPAKADDAPAAEFYVDMCRVYSKRRRIGEALSRSDADTFAAALNALAAERDAAINRVKELETLSVRY